MHNNVERHCAGQALVEAVVVLTVLVPLLLAILMLGRYQSVRQSVDAGARALAFDCSARGARCASDHLQPSVRNALARLTLSSVDDPIESLPAMRSPTRTGPTFWTDSAGMPLVESLQSWEFQTVEDPLDAGRSVALGGSRSRPAAMSVLEHAGPQRFGLDLQGGLFRFSGAHAVRLHGIQPWRTLGLPDLRVSWSSATLCDPWNASGVHGKDPDRFESRVMSALDPPNALVQVARDWVAPAVGNLERMGRAGLENNAGAFTPLEFDVGVMPPDRLGVAQ